MMIPKPIYRRIRAELRKLSEEDLQDRRESPSAIPIGWRLCIESRIESIFREAGQRLGKGQASEIIEQLIEEGHLVRYMGDVTFPDRHVPDEQEMTEKVKKTVGKLFNQD